MEKWIDAINKNMGPRYNSLLCEHYTMFWELEYSEWPRVGWEMRE